MKTININYSIKGLKKIDFILDEIKKIFFDKKGLYEYIAKKCIKELNQISIESLSSYDEETIDSSYYVSNHKYEIEGEYLYIYNDSIIDISSKNMSEETKANYPAQLSLAKIVEYGIGPTGASSTNQSEVENWEYNINQEKHIEKYGNDGWYYVTENGNIRWTTGFEGRLIFSKLANRVKEKAAEWIDEYIEKEIKRLR